MKRQIKLAMRDYVLAGLIVLPGLVVSFVFLARLAKMSDMCQAMHLPLPMHLALISHVWIEWYLELPWSAMVTVVPFVIFEVTVRTERKATIRQVILLILVLVSASFNAFTAWSVANVQDQALRACTVRDLTAIEPSDTPTDHSHSTPPVVGGR